MVFVPFIYFTFLCVCFRIKHGRFEVSAYLAALYALSAFFSIVVFQKNLFDIRYEIQSISSLPTFIYCGLLTLTFTPFSALHSEDIKNIEQPKMWFFNALSYIFIGTFFITIVALVPEIIDNVRSGEILSLRYTIYDDSERVKLTGIRYAMAIPSTIFSPCSPLMVIMYFYSVCFLNKKRIFNALLLLSSFTPILSAILISGRTQIMYWIMVFVACYLFFYPYIDRRTNKTIIIFFSIFGGLIILFFIGVTLTRWEESELAISALERYAGEPFLQFCSFFERANFVEPHFQRLFPFTHYFILGQDIDLFVYREILYDQSGIYANVFNTFLGDVMLDIGHVGMFIYAILYTLLTRWALKRNDRQLMPFYQLPIFIICLLVPLEGLFFYSFHTVRMSYYIIETFIICFIFKYSFKR